MKMTLAFCISFVLATLLFSAIYSFDHAHKIHRRVDRAILYLQWFHQAQFAGFYVANNKGFYDDVDLEVDIRPRPLTAGEDWSVPRIVSASTDRDDKPKAFGIWVGDQVLRQYAEENLQIAAIGTVFDRSLACFMVKDQSNIFGPHDFGDKRVGLFKGYDTEIIYNWLVAHYPPPTPAHTVLLNPTADATAQLRSGDVDVWPAYAINEPLAAEAAHPPLHVRLIFPDYYNIGYYSDTLIVNRRTLERHRDVVERFTEASERGWRYALENRDEAVKIVVGYDRLRLGRLIEQQQLMLNKMTFYVRTFNPMLGMDEPTWASMADILQQQGALKDVGIYKTLCDFNLAKDAHKLHRE
jgi:ABC-type nitrate/sulfonate/bicarbonate transport system substrate-binding protein